MVHSQISPGQFKPSHKLYLAIVITLRYKLVILIHKMKFFSRDEMRDKLETKHYFNDSDSNKSRPMKIGSEIYLTPVVRSSGPQRTN